MKFGIGKLPQSFYRDTEKNFKRKKSSKELSPIDDRKVNANLCHNSKIFFHFSNSVPLLSAGPGGPRPPHFGLLKIFFETLCSKKTDNDAKRSNI